MQRLVNKKRSRTAIFSIKGAQRRLIGHTPNQSQKEIKLLQDNLDGFSLRRIQDGSFIEV